MQQYAETRKETDAAEAYYNMGKGEPGLDRPLSSAAEGSRLSMDPWPPQHGAARRGFLGLGIGTNGYSAAAAAA